MPHVDIDNRTPFACESLVLADEEGMPQFVPLVQASFAIDPAGDLTLLDPQPTPNLAGEWHGDPAAASVRLEPQTAFVKPSTDVVLLGHACAPSRGTTELQVGIRVGPVRQLARVTGDRFLSRRGGVSAMSAPQPFERIPLIYERTFGGWDRHDDDPLRHRCEPRNPVGVAFRAAPLRDDEFAVPNIEDPQRPFRGYGDVPTPIGFGFIGPNWAPRLSFAGTYDQSWDQSRKPLLPADFDRRFFNAASPGLVAPEYLKGNEPVVIVGASANGRVAFDLPGVPFPDCVTVLRGGRRVQAAAPLDTVIVDMDQQVLTMMWRTRVAVRNGMHDVVALEIAAPGWERRS
jgi:hypothetical protein